MKILSAAPRNLLDRMPLAIALTHQTPRGAGNLSMHSPKASSRRWVMLGEDSSSAATASASASTAWSLIL